MKTIINKIKDWIYLLKFPAKELRRLVEYEMEKQERAFWKELKEEEIPQFKGIKESLNKIL